MPIISMDFFPTILAATGHALCPYQHIDGVDLTPVLKKSGGLNRDAIYWHYPHYHGSTWKPGASIRDGDWKLIAFYHYDTVELYNLAKDPSEKKDLSKSNPQKTKELEDKLVAWQKRMKAKIKKSVK